MKLSEVIKSKGTFKLGTHSEIQITDQFFVVKTREAALMYNLNIDDWQEVKPPRQWSEKELMLFKLLPDWAKWIATDEDGTIFLYENKPKKNIATFNRNVGDEHDYLLLSAFDFLTITFEESPVYIGDLKGE